MSAERMPRKQKNYSFPEAVDQRLEKFLADNRAELEKIGITNKTKLMEVLSIHGERPFLRILDAVKGSDTKPESQPPKSKQ